jgi:hypothetical protein
MADAYGVQVDRRVPLTGDKLEAVGASVGTGRGLRLARNAGVDASFYLLTRLVAP